MMTVFILLSGITDSNYVVAYFVLIIHLLVDLITKMYGTKGITAVRINGNSKRFKHMRLFFSFYQFLAIAAHLSNKSLIDAGFNTLIAIQSSAFLMTLKRKNLINWVTYAIGYGISLVLSMYCFYLQHDFVFFTIVGIIFYIRIKFNFNKYILWTIFTMFYYNVLLQ
jgi:hypothetical protein